MESQCLRRKYEVRSQNGECAGTLTITFSRPFLFHRAIAIKRVQNSTKSHIGTEKALQLSGFDSNTKSPVGASE